MLKERLQTVTLASMLHLVYRPELRHAGSKDVTAKRNWNRHPTLPAARGCVKGCVCVSGGSGADASVQHVRTGTGVEILPGQWLQDLRVEETVHAKQSQPDDYPGGERRVDGSDGGTDESAAVEVQVAEGTG
jgi:hypothetical protein